MLTIGDSIPDFKLQDQNGKWHQLSDLLGRKWILFIYPAASTPTCTVEACNMRDHYAHLNEAGFEVFGLSADTVAKQQKFAEKNNFTYPLLADTEKALIQALGVWGPKKFMGREYDGIHRTTFIIDEKGKIQRVIDKVKSKEHAAQILESL